MKKVIIPILGILLTYFCNGQEVENKKYEYENLDVNLKKDYNNAKFIINYYFTDGGSLGDRYSYEIIVTDSIMTLMFNAPAFGSYNYLKYVKQIQLEQEDLDTIKMVIKNANLKQIHQGIPHWQGTMYTREVLILKLDNLFIAGGQTYGPEGTYSDDESEDKVRQEVEKDKRASSSITGDYDSIINLLKKYFTNINELHKEALININ